MDDSHWFRNHPYYEESNISKNPNNPKGKPIPLKGEFYEQNFRHSEQSEDLKRAASEEYRREAESRYANSIERYGKLL